MGWGLSLHMQLNTKKFSRLRRDQAIATRSPSTSHLTTFGKSNRLATLTQTSSLRSHHTTTPPRYARAYQLATLAHCTHHERIGVDRHTRRLCLSARKLASVGTHSSCTCRPNPYFPNTYPTFLVRSTLTSFGAHQFRHALTTFALTAHTQPGVCPVSPSGGIYITVFVRCHSFMRWLVWFFVWVGWVVLCEQPDA